MTARDVQRSALGVGRILLGVIMAIVVPVWQVLSLLDYTRLTVPANELVTPSVDVYDETGSFELIDAYAERRPRWCCVRASHPPRHLVDG